MEDIEDSDVCAALEGMMKSALVRAAEYRRRREVEESNCLLWSTQKLKGLREVWRD